MATFTCLFFREETNHLFVLVGVCIFKHNKLIIANTFRVYLHTVDKDFKAFVVYNRYVFILSKAIPKHDRTLIAKGLV